MLGDIFSPLSVLKTFTMIELIEQIVGSTNTYAGMIINIPKIQERISQTKKVCLTWKPITADECWVYFAVLFLMGIIQKPQFVMYWSQDHTPILPLLI